MASVPIFTCDSAILLLSESDICPLSDQFSSIVVTFGMSKDIELPAVVQQHLNVCTPIQFFVFLCSQFCIIVEPFVSVSVHHCVYVSSFKSCIE